MPPHSHKASHELSPVDTKQFARQQVEQMLLQPIASNLLLAIYLLMVITVTMDRPIYDAVYSISEFQTENEEKSFQKSNEIISNESKNCINQI